MEALVNPLPSEAPPDPSGAGPPARADGRCICFLAAGVVWRKQDTGALLATLPDGRAGTVGRIGESGGFWWSVGDDAGLSAFPALFPTLRWLARANAAAPPRGTVVPFPALGRGR
jgi:hypothetical protein